MIKHFLFYLPKRQQSLLSLIFSLLLIVSAFLVIKAQPEFSQGDVRVLKGQKFNPDSFQHSISQEKFPMPDINTAKGAGFADGDLDPTFNVSITEGLGYVNKSVVQPDGKIIVVGLFHRVGGVRLNGIARLNADGTLDATFNSGTGANSAIRTVAQQADGKIIVAGAFTSFNGQAVNRIVRLNADGSIDSTFALTVNFNNQINDVAVQADGKILVGGQFTSPSSRSACLNSDGTFNRALGVGGTIYKILIQPDGKILFGTSLGIYRLNADFTSDTTFNSLPRTNDGSVSSLALQPDGKIILGGYFSSYGSTPTDNVARINSDGTLDLAFDFFSGNDAASPEINAVSFQSGGKTLVSYQYFGDSGFISRLTRFNNDGSIDSSFTTGEMEHAPAYSLTVLGDEKILAGGIFVSYNNQTRLHFAKLDTDGTVDNAFNPAVSTSANVYVIKQQADGKTLVGGDFEFVNGVRKSGIARLNANGTLDNSFTISAGFYGDVYDLEIQPDGKIVIGGVFSGSQDFPASCAARINADGSFDTTLNYEERLISVAYSVALQPDNKILVGGQVFNESLSDLIAAVRLNVNGTLDTGFAQTTTNFGTVRALAVQPSGKIVVGGTFFSQGGLQRSGLGRLNTDGTFDNSFSGSCPNTYALNQLANGSLYVGGFSIFGCGGSNAYNYIARLNVDGVADASFNTSNRATDGVRAIEIQSDGKVLIGGLFLTYEGVTVNRITRLNANGTLDTTFNSGGTGASGNVYALNVQADGKILVGGNFFNFNGVEKFSIARLKNSAGRPKTPFDFDGDSKTDISIFRSSVGEWWYQRSSDGQVPAVQFGSSTDKPVPADFTGDGKTDVAFWRPSSGEWFILRSEDSGYLSFPFGASGDVPQVGDFDADGKADPTVFRPSTGEWFISKSTGGTVITTFGQAGDLPVAADFDGDGRVDIAIFRPSDGSWWYLRSSDNQFRVFRFGVGTDKPVPGDYTGDGKADIAVFRPSTGEWFFQRSEDNSYYSVPFGASGDIPAPGDYDGDGRFDTAVFRPAGSTWYINRTTAGLLIQQFGLATDTPVPSAFVP